MIFLKTICVVLAIFSSVAFSHELPSIAVIDFDATNTQHEYLGSQCAEIIGDAVSNTNIFIVVVDREKLKTILDEQELSASGIVDPDYVIKMGALIGAEYIMTGKVVSANIKTTTFSGYGVDTTTVTYTIKVRARILDTKTGQVVFSRIEKATASKPSTGKVKTSEDGEFSDLIDKIANLLASHIVQSGKF